MYTQNFKTANLNRNNPFKNNLEIKITFLLHLHRKQQLQTIGQKMKIYVVDSFVTKTKGKISLYLGRGSRE